MILLNVLLGLVGVAAMTAVVTIYLRGEVARDTITALHETNLALRDRVEAAVEARRCDHSHTTPVDSCVTGETLARICLDCNAQVAA